MVLFLTHMALADGGVSQVVIAIDDDADANDVAEGRDDEVNEAVAAAARGGDHAAFAIIVEHYDDRLRAIAFQLLRDEQAVNDALQDAYVKAYLRLDTFRGEAGLGTWLYRVVYTTCLDHLRAVSRRPPVIEARDEARAGRSGEVSGFGTAGATGARGVTSASVVTHPDHADVVAARCDLEALLAELPPEQRAAVIMVDAHGLGFARAAEVLGIPQGTVASRVASARRKLRRALAARDQDGGEVTS